MTATTERTASDFSPLLGAIRGAGLLRLRRRRYAGLIALDLLAFTAVWTAVWFVGNTWWQLFLAVPAAVFTVRMIFIGHDVGHRQIAGSRKVHDGLGFFVGDFLVGLSSRWWIDKHSRHHANPNQVGRDPDVADGAVSWTPEQAAAVTGGVGRWFRRNQGRLFFPVLLLEALNLHHGSFRVARRPHELVLLGLHVIAYLGLLVMAMGPGKAAVFVLVHQALVGLHLGCAFAPNHKGMPMPPPEARWDFTRKQVLTSRNVRGGVMTDWFLGGLNYQIEHHLFPSMPRPHLRHAQRLVREHCIALGLPYTEETLTASLMLTVRHLQDVGNTAEPASSADRRRPCCVRGRGSRGRRGPVPPSVRPPR